MDTFSISLQVFKHLPFVSLLIFQKDIQSVSVRMASLFVFHSIELDFQSERVKDSRTFMGVVLWRPQHFLPECIFKMFRPQHTPTLVQIVSRKLCHRPECRNGLSHFRTHSLVFQVLLLLAATSPATSYKVTRTNFNSFLWFFCCVLYAFLQQQQQKNT
jgi:hypothetical protein